MLIIIVSLLLCSCQQEKESIDFIETGKVAVNQNLCRSLQWEDGERAKIVQLYNEYLYGIDRLVIDMEAKKLTNVEFNNKKSVLLSSMQRKLDSFAGNEVAERIATAQLARNSYFALKMRVFSKYLEIDEVRSQTINNHIITIMNSIDKKVKASFDLTKVHNRNDLESTCRNIVRDLEVALEQHFNEVSSKKSKAKYQGLRRKLDKMGMNPECVDIYNIVYATVVGELKSKNKLGLRATLLVQKSALRYAVLPGMQKLLQLSKDESEGIIALNTDLEADYALVKKMYFDQSITDRGKHDEIWSIFQKTINSQIINYDKKLATVMKKSHLLRLQEIIKQCQGAQSKFEFGENAKYQNTDLQRAQLEQIRLSVDAKYRINREVYGDDGEARFKAVARNEAIKRYEISFRIINEVFTEQQRQMWNSEVGNLISKDDFILVVCEILSLNSNINK